MSNSKLPAGHLPYVLETNLAAACRLITSASSASGTPAPGAEWPLRSVGRPDTLTAQRVEVGIVLHAMLGLSAATDYFAKHALNPALALRVLSPSGRRRGNHDANGIRT